MMSRFYYNITFHCEPSVAEELLVYLRQTLIPEWAKRSYWHSPRLMRVHSSDLETVSFALQLELESVSALTPFQESADPLLKALMVRFPRQVMPFSVLMEEC